MKGFAKTIKIISLSILGLILLLVLLLCGVTLYLTPSNLTRIINTQASKYLSADVTVSNARFTFWSSFPHLCIITDSISINSRTLKDVSPDIRAALPPDADFLASAKSLRGNINIIRAFSNKYYIKNVDIDGLKINMVAYNDSINNYDILPTDASITKSVPFISANQIRISKPWSISYFSAATDTKASAMMRNASLVHLKGKGENYNLQIPGIITASTGNLNILTNFPFELNGRVSLNFKPFSFRFSDYSINLGNTHGKLNMDAIIGNQLQINNLSYRISPFNLCNLLQYLPQSILANNLPEISNVAADLNVFVSARLTAPYRLSSDSLPSLEVDFNVPPGNLSYSLSDGKTYPLSHSAAYAKFIFNGNNPNLSYIRLLPLELSTPGGQCSISARISRLTQAPLVEAELKANADINKVVQPFLSKSLFKLRGLASCHSSISFSVPSFSIKDITSGLHNLSLSGSASVKHFAFNSPQDSIALASKSSSIDFSTSAPLLTSNLAMLPLKLKLRASDFSFSSPQAHITTGPIAISSTTKPSASKYKDLSHRARPLPAASIDDARTLAFAPHTPEFISVQVPKSVKSLINSLATNTSISVASGRIRAKAFPACNTFSHLNIFTNLDSIALRSLNLRSQSTAIQLNGSVANLRRFLSLPSPQELRLNLNVNLDTVNINQLAHAYESGVALTKGVKATFHHPDMPISSSDSVAFLVPRNLKANINASAKETVYMNLHLYDLATNIDIADGNANVENLHISSDFGQAALNLRYNTADMQKMAINTDVDISKINVVNFFKNFHTLLLMMPQMKNLSGVVSAKLSGGVQVFPDMYLNVPSLHADISMKGDSLTVHQNPFIRRITRMMLIHTADDIHIDNMDVKASVHDNLIELYPFNFIFDRYRLNMLGTNNFDGDLYYHIGVLKSPVPFPFAINITGQFHHPQLHFGGAKFKTLQSEKITSSVMEKSSFNLVKEIKHYLAEFIEKAAESDTTLPSQFDYPVPDYRAARKASRP